MESTMFSSLDYQTIFSTDDQYVIISFLSFRPTNCQKSRQQVRYIQQLVKENYSNTLPEFHWGPEPKFRKFEIQSSLFIEFQYQAIKSKCLHCQKTNEEQYEMIRSRGEEKCSRYIEMIAFLINRHAHISIFIPSAAIFGYRIEKARAKGPAYVVIALQNFSISLELEKHELVASVDLCMYMHTCNKYSLYLK